MIRSSVKIFFAPEQEHEIVKILRSLASRTRVQSGCMSCSIYRDADSDHTIVYEDEWSSIFEMQSYLRSGEYGKLLLVIEMALQPPEIRFDTVTHTAGMEIIEKARI